MRTLAEMIRFVPRPGKCCVALFGGGLLALSGLARAETPYASEVVAYVLGAGIDIDWMTGEEFSNPQTALGRPATLVRGTSSTNFPVVPVYQPWQASDLVAIGSGGSLVLGFDHPVEDDPANPYGVDFIVYGNTPIQIGSGTLWQNGDPGATRVSDRCAGEVGVVSVSQDGTNWFTFTNGPYADDFPPSLGFQYDPEHADTNIFAGNRWWSLPTDPTFPIDPGIQPGMLKNWTVGDVARHYRASAGGTGLDIGRLDLPVDAATGRKWFRYVRFERGDAVNPDIDAVADVAAAPGYVLWRLQHFPWLGDPDRETDWADPNSNGVPNVMEYVLGGDPTNQTAVIPFSAGCGLAQKDGRNWMAVRYIRAQGTEDVPVLVEVCTNWPGTNWSSAGVVQDAARHPLADKREEVTALVPLNRAGVVRLKIR